MINKRARTRIQYYGKATVKTKTSLFRNLICRDVSLNGAFFETSLDLQAGESVEISLLFPENQEDGLIQLKGTIVRNNLEGFAVAFFEMDELSFQHLKRLIEYRAGEAHAIEKELHNPTFGKLD